MPSDLFEQKGECVKISKGLRLLEARAVYRLRRTRTGPRHSLPQGDTRMFLRGHLGSLG